MTYLRNHRTILLTIGYTITCFSTFAQEHCSPGKLHAGHQAIIGLGMGIADALATTPFYYIKNMLQVRQKAISQGKPLPKINKNPITWFTGTTANCIGLIAGTQCQNISFEALQSNHTSAWSAAMASGALSAFVACPADMILRHIQNKPIAKHVTGLKKSTLTTIQQLHIRYGWKCFTRGLGATIIRDAVFSSGYLVAIPQCRNTIENNTHNSLAKTMATICAGLGIGLCTTIATHPFDTIAGNLQNDPGGKTYTNTIHATKKIYNIHGIKSFFSGILPRAAVVSLSILVLDEAKNTLSNALK